MQNYEVMYHKIITKNLKSLRKKAKISQEKLAEELDCSREFVSRLENNREKLSLKMLFKISYFFKIKPQELFEEDLILQFITE